MVAEIYLEQKQFQKALMNYKKGLVIEPNKHLIWNQVLFLEADLFLHDSLIIDEWRGAAFCIVDLEVTRTINPQSVL